MIFCDVSDGCGAYINNNFHCKFFDFDSDFFTDKSDRNFMPSKTVVVNWKFLLGNFCVRNDDPC